MDTAIISLVFVALFLGSSYLGIYVAAGLGRRLGDIEMRLFLAEQRESILLEQRRQSVELFESILTDGALLPGLLTDVQSHLEQISKPVQVKRVITHLSADPSSSRKAAGSGVPAS